MLFTPFGYKKTNAKVESEVSEKKNKIPQIPYVAFFRIKLITENNNWPFFLCRFFIIKLITEQISDKKSATQYVVTLIISGNYGHIEPMP